MMTVRPVHDFLHRKLQRRREGDRSGEEQRASVVENMSARAVERSDRTALVKSGNQRLARFPQILSRNIEPVQGGFLLSRCIDQSRLKIRVTASLKWPQVTLTT